MPLSSEIYYIIFSAICEVKHLIKEKRPFLSQKEENFPSKAMQFAKDMV